MKRALLIAFMMIVPPKYNFELHETLEEVRIIKEEQLEYVRLSCYTAPEGAHCADGTLAKEGVCSSNKEHIGKLCVLYDDDLNPIDAFYCHDVGSNSLLVSGKAVDIYRSSYQRCVDFIKLHGDYAYIRWVDPENGGTAEWKEEN